MVRTMSLWACVATMCERVNKLRDSRLSRTIDVQQCNWNFNKYAIDSLSWHQAQSHSESRGAGIKEFFSNRLTQFQIPLLSVTQNTAQHCYHRHAWWKSVTGLQQLIRYSRFGARLTLKSMTRHEKCANLIVNNFVDVMMNSILRDVLIRRRILWLFVCCIVCLTTIIVRLSIGNTWTFL